MIQLIINSTLLREIDERALINRYARFCYEDEESVTNDTIIQQNLANLLDWDANGTVGVPIFCSRYESIKRRDWPRLIQFIKDNKAEIKSIAYVPLKRKKLENIKQIQTREELRELKNIETFTNPDYEVSNRGKEAKPCIYEGREYKSRQECRYKEGLTQNQLYRYLERTGQV